MRSQIESKRQELVQMKNRLHAAKDDAERAEYKKRTKRAQVELSQLRRKLEAADEPETGALPDFVVIGAAKSGTTFFYHLLSQHPYVRPAVVKEPHFFNVLFEEGIEWYRRCFPQPRWEDGRRTITGEASPGYIWHPLAPRRMSEAIPHARLIALLRNPVDRAYSAYHHRVRKGNEPRTFERAIEAAMGLEEALAAQTETRPPGTEAEGSELGDRTGRAAARRSGYLFRGIYVDPLQRWSQFFDREQMLVLKSEDFFERPSETLKPVFDFLGLPQWEPNASELPEQRKNKGGYEQAMAPRLRRRLEEFFEPHNRRLYEHLGVDFGW